MNDPTPTSPAVSIRDVYKSYRIGSVINPVLHGIDLEIPFAGLSVLAGPSGSGKTTLLNLIGCIDKPDRGSVNVLGVQEAELSDAALSDFRRANIGFVFQNFNLLPVLTAHENIEYPLHLAGLGPAERRRMVGTALEQVGLADQSGKYPSQMSGGQRQRVAIARALVKRPKLVLADEPTANLDSETGAAIIELMKTLQAQERVAFVISSHDQQVHAHADRVFVMHDGRLQSPGDAPAGH